MWLRSALRVIDDAALIRGCNRATARAVMSSSRESRSSSTRRISGSESDVGCSKLSLSIYDSPAAKKREVGAIGKWLFALFGRQERTHTVKPDLGMLNLVCAANAL
ncbi:hypothetical protein D3C71_1658210 [compost metagenome]